MVHLYIGWILDGAMSHVKLVATTTKGKVQRKKIKKKLTSVSFMYVCVAENVELLFFFYFFCIFPIGNFLS